MTSSLLNIGQSALAVAQAGLATTGHNVANASTPGYNRQMVRQSAIAGQDMGFGFIGKGAQVSSVSRVYDEFLSTQLVSTQSAKSRLEAYYGQIKRLDSLVADPQTGVSPALQNFFKSVQNITAEPNGAASRQALLSSSNGLIGSFQTLDSYFSEMQAGVNSEITASVSTINAYAKQIAKLNDSIEKTMSSLGAHPANDLLDQRDQLINELAKEIKVNVVKQGNSYNVFIGNGQPLVLGTQTMALVTAANPSDPHRVQVSYSINGVPQSLPESMLSGGRLGGLLEFRAQSLDATQNALGRMAIGFATTFNEQHRQGMNQNGEVGRDFFNIDLTTSVTVKRADGTEITATTDIVDISQLTTSDYRLNYDGSNYHITRLSDGVVRSFGTMPQTLDGIAFGTDVSAVAGDNILIRPTARAISTLSLAVTHISDIAVAAPFVTGAPLANQGTGTISAGSVTDHTELTNHRYEIVFNVSGGTTTYDVIDLTVGPPALSSGNAYTPGENIAFDGLQFTISGQPQDGDKFTVEPTLNHEGDSRNAIALGDLQGKSFFNGGTTTYQGAYAQMVSAVGNLTREVEVTSAAAGRLYNQTLQSQQSVSGVNLDEEAANLIRYQHAYQAAGKIMQTATQLFDTLLQIGR